MLRHLISPSVAAATLAMAAAVIPAQQNGVALSPFVTFLPTGSAHPMAGLALSVAGGPLALRASGHLSMQERSNTTSDAMSKPWGADADAMAFLDSYGYRDRVLFAPYVFVGIGTAALDSSVYRLSRQNWSYGGGLNAPLSSALGLFGEVRWRMSEFVMPNATDAPPTTREFRVGLNFRVGGGGSMSDVIRVIATDGGALAADDSWTGSSGTAGVLATADEYVGTPYRRGGSSPSSGFDAAGFVRFIFSRFGVTLPRSSRDLARVGEPLRTDWRALAPGDLVMFEDEGGINHVAIYVGRARIIHSSETGGGVRYDDLNTDRGRWFVEHLAAARRITPGARGMLVDLARGFSSNGDGWDEPDHAPRAPLRKRGR